MYIYYKQYYIIYNIYILLLRQKNAIEFSYNG